MVSVTAPYGELMCKRLFDSANLVCKVARGNKVPKEDMKRGEYARIIPLVSVLVRFVDTYIFYGDIVVYL